MIVNFKANPIITNNVTTFVKVQIVKVE